MRRLMLALALVLTACSSDSRDVSPTASAGISGSYVLSTVNDQPLPFSLPDGRGTISAGRLTIVSNDSLDISSTISFGSGPPSTQVRQFGYDRNPYGLVATSGFLQMTINGDSRAVMHLYPGPGETLRLRYVK